MAILTKTATLEPGANPGNTPTSGLGSLASQLIKNQSNLLAPNQGGGSDYMSRILQQEGPTTLALGPKAYVDTRDLRSISDAYQYYLQGMGGGQEAAAAPAAPVAQTPAAPVTTGGGGGQGLAVAPGITGTSAAQNMGG